MIEVLCLTDWALALLALAPLARVTGSEVFDRLLLLAELELSLEEPAREAD